MTEYFGLKPRLLALAAILAAGAALADIDRGLEGVYVGVDEHGYGNGRISLSAEGFAELDVDGVHDFSSWRTEVIRGRRYQILDVFDSYKTMAIVLTNGVLQIVAYDDDLDEVKDDIFNGGGVDRELSRFRFRKTTEDEIDSELVVKARKAQEAANVRMRSYERDRRNSLARHKIEKREEESWEKVEPFCECVRTNSEFILTVKLVYPTKAEIDEYYGRTDFAYNDDIMGIVGSFSLLPRNHFKEETLLKFIDKCDWRVDRGLCLVFYAFMRDEIGADSRRKYAPRILPYCGVIDDDVMAYFLDHVNTPSDVIREALATKKLYAELEGRLERRLMNRGESLK